MNCRLSFLATGFLLILFTSTSQAIGLTAYISQNGIHGAVQFSSTENEILLQTKISTQEQWSWEVREFPVVYTGLKDRCTDEKLGKTILNLSEVLGPLTNDSSRLTLRPDQISLMGENGLWSRSLLLKSSGSVRACATIMGSGNSSVKVAEAYFSGENGINGRVLIQWFGSHLGKDAAIYSDLFYAARKTQQTQHEWRVYTTDILDTEADKERSDCNSLQAQLLDLTARVGRVSTGLKLFFKDPSLLLWDISSRHRNHYLILIDNDHPENFLACARIRNKPPTLLKALINSKGVKGVFSLSQESIFTPTRVVLHVTDVAEPVLGGFRIHTLPAFPSVGNSVTMDFCGGIGGVFNPTEQGVASEAPIPGEETQDKYAVGDVSGKVGYAAGKEWDSFLPLSGPSSVALRTFVIYRNGEGGLENPWICSRLVRYSTLQLEYKVPMVTAEAIFRYPLVGKILFEQPLPFGETTVLVEGLVHADGTSLNTTKDHRWGIHINPPGHDFYNWTARCVSAGVVYDPYKININDSMVGALAERLGRLIISGSKKVLQESRLFFVDDHLPLYGRHSILDKSLVIFDDHGPKARGDRLACSKISSVMRRKAVARDWFGNGSPVSVSGKIEFFQQSEYGITDIEVNLKGLQNIQDYHIHMVPVLEILEFPCEETTLYGIYNPYQVPDTPAKKNAIGTTDENKLGDLSGKYGSLLGHTSLLQTPYNDSMLMVFGQKSILARSVVLFTETGKRWACATIERGYAPSEAREIRGIASFHHPNGYAYGYIRMTQLIHYDGSMSETVIEVNLRHPGSNDKNMTRNHNWAIYVNPVGVDAAVKVLNTRCTAAGYIWNPYYTQLADPLNDELYRRECGEDLPLRCYVGDLSGRLGPIDLGVGRKAFSDPNFPLEGKISAMGKSIVILNKDFGNEKFACANIEPDFNTIKYVNVRKPPRFVVSQFLDDVRGVMGIPDWFLTVDSRKTNVLFNGACIQLLVHFKGPDANKLEQDFNRLLVNGHLSSPSLYIPGYIPDKKKRKTSLSYKLCSSKRRGEEENDVYESSFTSRILGSAYITVAASVLLIVHSF